MSIKNRVSALEAKLKIYKREEGGCVVFIGRTDKECELRKAEYLKDNPMPELYINMIRSTDDDYKKEEND